MHSQCVSLVAALSALTGPLRAIGPRCSRKEGRADLVIPMLSDIYFTASALGTVL